MNRTVILSFLFSTISFAQAQTAQDQYAWRCGAPNFLNDFAIDRGDVKFNNFILSEGNSSTIDGFKSINFSFSVVNRKPKSYVLSYQLAALDQKGNPTFAIGFKGGFVGVGPSSVEQVGGGVHVQNGDLGRTAKLCLRIIGAAQ